MKVLDARVSMFLDKQGQRYANAPDLDILVEYVPHDLELKWSFIAGEHDQGLFWAKEDGFYRTYFHNGDDQNHGGLGGAAVTLPMVDGSEKIICGPWCGNPRAAKEEFFMPELIDVTLYEQSWSRVGCANWWVTPEVARACLKRARFYNEKEELPYRAVLVVGNAGAGLQEYDIAIVKNTRNTPDTLRAEYL